MTWNDPDPRPRGLPAHLGRLGEQLTDLAGRVRAAVADVVGDAVGRAARDAVARLLGRSHVPPGPRGPRAWDDEADDDAWEEDGRWERPTRTASRPDHAGARAALLLQAGGWWLLRRGPIGGAAVLALAAGALAFVALPAGAAGVLAGAAADLLALDRLCRAGAALADARDR
jgi:hypothetical protein